MHLSTEPQVPINLRRREIVQRYPDIWTRIIAEWKSPGPDDRAWLMYSSNYLFRTGGLRWALDPLTLHWRLPEAQPVDAIHDLEGLSFILLTHRHADHLDLELVRALKDLPALWVIPKRLLVPVAASGLPRTKIIVPKPLEALEIEGMKITPFDSAHWETDTTCPGRRRGVPETGYLLEFCGKRWLFPGDIRTYDANELPSMGPVDGLFAHLWLGHGCALNEKPPLLERFCSFCLDLQPKRVVLTHLNEFGRRGDDYWHEGHVHLVNDWFRNRGLDGFVEYACLGQGVKL